MGLFDIFKKKEAPATSTAPANPSTSSNVAELHAPISGKAIRMAEVPDPVFSSEILGKGCAIWPEDDVVTSPVAGEVTVTMGHAVGIMSESGVEVLVHVGVDTVNRKARVSPATSNWAIRSPSDSRCSRWTAPPSPKPATRTA